jgi:hypothetical protein
MCDHDDEAVARAMLQRHQPHSHGISRRDFLRAAAGTATALGAGVLVSGSGWGASPSVSTRSTEPSGATPVNIAMHVHASWSEGDASWDTQYASAVENGIQVMYMTDHNHRVRATGYLTSLSGDFITTTSGGPYSDHVASLSDGSMRLMLKASSSNPSAEMMTMDPGSTARDQLRTGMAGQSLTITYGKVVLPSGGMHEVVINLSTRPATGGRPAGTYLLRYRFMPDVTKQTYSTSGQGLIGLINMPSIDSGSVVTLTPENDIAAIWPDILTLDNGFNDLAFGITTGAEVGSVTDITIASVSFSRTEANAAAAIANQKAIIEAYAARYPALMAIMSEEVSAPDGAVVPHCNVFGAAPKFDSMEGITANNFRSYYLNYIEQAQAMVHGQAGFITWNHPYGFSFGGPEDPDPATVRRNLFTTQINDPVAPWLGAMGLEIGYIFRGGMPIQEHIDLWDTMTRHGVWLTGTGANDMHNTAVWSGLANGFFTGVFPTAVTDQAIAAGLRSGNAFTAHPGQWPGASLSMEVDTVPMGGILLGSSNSRTATITLAGIPDGFTLQLLSSPVDYQGVDPQTSIVTEWTSRQVGSGASRTVSAPVTQSKSSFFRAQVVNNHGVPIATGNPCIFLTSEPPGGIPVDRQVE